MKPWRTLRRETLLDLGPRLRVERHAVELHDGRVIDDWSWVVTPPYANVIAVTPDGRFVAFRQTKYSTGETLAPVGGHIEPGETPLQAAQRELREETGYAAPAANWTFMGTYAVDSNRGAGTASLFLATGAVFVGAAASDDLEEQVLLLLTRAEVNAAVREGAFRCLPWAAAFALALLRLDGAV